jgi:HSP20 family protein
MTKTKDRAGAALAPAQTNSVATPPQKIGAITYRPRLNMYDLGDRYEMHVDLPGSSSEQIQATLDDGLLTIEAGVPPRGEYTRDISPWRAEYGVGDFRRQVRLGEDIDGDRLTAKYEHGVLTLVLPKLPERQPRRVTIVNR